MDSLSHSNKALAGEGAVPSPFNMNLGQLRDAVQDSDVLPVSQGQAVKMEPGTLNYSSQQQSHCMHPGMQSMMQTSGGALLAALQQQQQQLPAVPAATQSSDALASDAATAALNSAARQQLLQAIGGMQGMTPEAQAALMQMVAGMGTVDQQQQQQQSGSPIKSSSAVSSGALQQLGQLGAAAAGAVPAPVADDSTQELADSLTDADGLLSSAAAASAFAALSETRHLPASPLPPLQTLQQQQEDSDTAQLGSLKGNLSLLPGSLRSQATYKTRELAAAAGAVRHGPAGANLRLAGTICRSSSGSLVDALLSEAARVECGLLTAGLPRSDSLPDMVCGDPNGPGFVDPVQAALDAALAQGGMNSVRDCLREIAAIDSSILKGLDSALPFTISGLGSLQLFMEAPSDLLAADDAAPREPAQQQIQQQQQVPPQASAAQQIRHESAAPLAMQQQQQQQQMQPPMGTPRAAPVATPFQGHSLLPGSEAVHPTRVISSNAPLSPPAVDAAAAAAPGSGWGPRTLGKPPSFSSRTTAAIFSHHAEPHHHQQQQQQQQPPHQEVCTDVTSSVFATHMASGALQPPLLLNPADTFNILPARTQQQQPQLRPRLSALRAASLQRRLMQSQQQMQQQQQQMQQQQVQQQQMQQQQVQQQAPADFAMFGMHMQGNISQAAPAQQLPLQQQQQLPQLGGVLGGLLGMGQAQQQDTLDGLLGQVNQELMREAGARQYAALQFGTLDTLGTPTASAAAAAAAVAGMGFGPACMGMPGGMQQQQQHWQQQGGLPGGAAAAGFGGGPAVGAGAGWMGGLPGQFGAPGMAQPQQQQQAQQQQQVALQGMQAGAADDSSQEVVRYSRVITCKTYLKRLNITQPMAEHLLPYHDLHAPPARNSSGGCAADYDGGDSPRGASSGSGKPGSTYELLFKEEVTVVDREGGRFRVQYEGVSCNQQKHLRLTSGWRDYIRAHNVEVGDTVVFERRGEERRVLFVSMVKGDGPPAADGPPSKRKRVSRAQAVQRLE